MIIYAIDDEPNVLTLIESILAKSVEGAKIYTFNIASDAVEAASEVMPDIVFTDIEMPGMNGIELAKRFKTINRKANIIFLTGYPQYARDAIRLHASGYIMKPPTANKIKSELDNLLHPLESAEAELYIKTFGYFDVLYKGVSIKFKREKCKELLALLVDRPDHAFTNEMISLYLFPEKVYDDKVKSLVSTIAFDLRKNLEEYGISDIIIKSWGRIQIDKSKFSCDVYDYIEGLPYAINQFSGEYMEEYSWAEDSKARFYWNSLEL